MVKRNVDGGIVARLEGDILERGRIGARFQQLGIQGIGIGDVKAQLRLPVPGVFTGERRQIIHGLGSRNAVEGKGPGLARTHAGAVRNPQQQISPGILVAVRLDGSAGLHPLITGGLVEKAHVRHHGLVVHRRRAGRESVDVHHHAYAGKGMGELHQGHASAGLGPHAGVVADEEIFLFQRLCRVKHNLSTLRRVSQRTHIVGVKHLLLPGPVKGSILRNAVGHEGVRAHGIGPVHALGSAVALPARPAAAVPRHEGDSLIVFRPGIGEFRNGILRTADVGKDGPVPAPELAPAHIIGQFGHGSAGIGLAAFNRGTDAPQLWPESGSRFLHRTGGEGQQDDISQTLHSALMFTG